MGIFVVRAFVCYWWFVVYCLVVPKQVKVLVRFASPLDHKIEQCGIYYVH